MTSASKRRREVLGTFVFMLFALTVIIVPILGLFAICVWIGGYWGVAFFLSALCVMFAAAVAVFGE